ncbi:MAG: hypothetical protein UY71_C0019G0001 [Parcubacteria group bacterium GW2011_GWB1_52_7]|nr:MAG: hypothetical protein UY71_C0019G0001 [Parcubacteria group bacterium GW2011_GWB1_52_7]
MNTDNDNKKLITMKPIKVEINTSTKFVIKMPILCNLLTTYKICKKIFLLFYDKASEEHAKLKFIITLFQRGAAGESRTLMRLPSLDFESSASASSATAAYCYCFFNHSLPTPDFKYFSRVLASGLVG